MVGFVGYKQRCKYCKGWFLVGVNGRDGRHYCRHFRKELLVDEDGVVIQV